MRDSVGPEPGRLNGWKEIAAHLRKGTRTVQRWERLYGLPVHRIGREGGEIVYAYRGEIDGWMAAGALERVADDEVGSGATLVEAPATEGPRERPTSRARAPWLVPVAVLALFAAALATVSLLGDRADEAAIPSSPPDPGRRPAGWRLANESLVVFDAKGAPLFEHRFGFPLGGDLGSDTWRVHEDGPAPVLIADLEGDGRSEVIVRPPAWERSERRLYCLEADGRIRWAHQPTGTRRFGDEDYADPWLAYRMFVTAGPAGGKRLWAVFTHNLLFPSVLQELDPKGGAVRQEYWSNGYIEHVSAGSWAGRPVVFVGGTNNDFREASLAVFAPDRVSGSTPAVRPAYACRDCAPGGPEALLLLPTLCVFRHSAGQAGVHDVWVESGDRVRLTVSQASPPTPAYSYYTLGPDGGLVAAEISREFEARHALLEKQGVLDHAFGRRDDADMFPVRRWDGRRFVELPRVRVTR